MILLINSNHFSGITVAAGNIFLAAEEVMFIANLEVGKNTQIISLFLPNLPPSKLEIRINLCKTADIVPGIE